MNMMREYTRGWCYHPDIEKLRELLSKVTDEQKLNILLQTKAGLDRTAPHKAAYRNDAEMITTILSAFQSADRIKFLMMENYQKRTPLHVAVCRGHTESVKAMLNSLTADQQMQLLAVEDWDSETAAEMASGETAEVLIRYSMNSIRETRKGKNCYPLRTASVHLC